MSEDQTLNVPDAELHEETPPQSRRSFLRTSLLGLSLIGAGSTLAACGGDDDDADDVDDAVNTVESEGEDAVDEVEDGAEDAEDEVEDAVDAVETDVDS